MIKNYILIAFRNFRRNLAFSVINILGLSIGISAAIVIYLIVVYDFSFDKHQKDANRIYRVVSEMHFPNQDLKNSGVPGPLGQAAQNEMSGVEVAAPFMQNDEIKITVKAASKNARVFKKDEGTIYADARYFKIINYRWLAGSATTALNQPYKTVITADKLKQYFGNITPIDAIGREVTYNDSIKTTITGVVADPNDNTDFNFTDFISISTLTNARLKIWGLNQWNSISSNSQLLLKLTKGANVTAVNKELANLHDRNVKNDLLKARYSLQPLADMHFSTDYDVYGHRRGNVKTLYGLALVGSILLLLGCINFINLTTARSAYRAKEIGVRKTMGSSRKQLIMQFMSETFVITFVAAILSLIIAPLLLKVFTDFIPPDLHFNLISQPAILFFTIGIIIVVAILSGLYPALVLAGYKPAFALKNQQSVSKNGTRNAWLRQLLTVIQFTAAQALIIATVIVAQQLHYMLNKDLGFDKNGIITITPSYNPASAEKYKVLLNNIKSLPQVDQAAIGGRPPAANGYATTVMTYEQGNKKIDMSPEIKYADASYFKLYNLKLLAGKYINPSDTINGLMINNTFAQNLGFKKPADAIGKVLSTQSRHVPIVGVLADFYFNSMHSAIKPLAYYAESPSYNYIHIKLKPNTDGNVWPAALKGIEAQWKKLYPEEDFAYKFLDDNIARFYKSEANISKLLSWATGLAILISCMGLLGLVMHTTVQRAKEISVRKILGASVTGIVTLLSSDFLKLVLLAIVIASPLAWLGVNKWLEGFAYKEGIHWWLFALSAGISIIIALATISFNAVKAAVANPVKSLRSE